MHKKTMGVLYMFYNRLKELCKNKGTSVTAMSKELGLSSGNVTNWKNGRLPKTAIMIQIANYLNVSVDYLMGETEEQKKPLVNNDEELTDYLQELKDREEMRMLFSVTKTCTKEEVEQAVRIIEALRKEK